VTSSGETRIRADADRWEEREADESSAIPEEATAGDLGTVVANPIAALAAPPLTVGCARVDPLSCER